MVDLFDEVEGQLRTDRYRTLALRIAPWVSGVLVVALVAALGYWGWDTWQTRQIHKASEDYDAAIQMADRGDRTGAMARFGQIARDAPPAYRALALMQQGGIQLADGHNDQAVALFDNAARTARHPIESDLAALQAIYVLLDTAPYADLERRITPLTAEGRPYRLQAQEALAMAKLLAGRTEEAKQAFQVLTLNLNTPEDMQRRARTALALIESGRSSVLREAVRAAATLPPPSAAITPLPPGVVPQGSAGVQPGTAQ